MRTGRTLTSSAGVYHVASRLAFAGFRVGLTNGRISDADIMVSLAGKSSLVTVQVKTSRWAMKTENRSPHRYEWDIGRKITQANNPHHFVAFVDLKKMERMPDVFLLPSKELRGYCDSLSQSERCRYRPFVEEVEPYRNCLDTLADHLRDDQRRWFVREDLEEWYGEDFVKEVETEASRLLKAENSTLPKMADDNFSAQELAEASALLRILFRHRKEKG